MRLCRRFHFIWVRFFTRVLSIVEIVMDDFYKELHIPIILFSGMRVPKCKGTMFQSKVASFFYDLYAIFTDVIVYLSFISIGWGTFMPEQPTVSRCVSGLAFMATLMSSLKNIYCIIHPNDLNTIFKLWDGYFDNDPFYDDLVQKVAKQKRRIRTITLWVFLFVTPSASLWGLLPYLPVMQRLHGKNPIVPAWFPFDTSVSPKFELAVLFQTLGAVYVTSKNVAFDSLFYNLLARQTAQIQHQQSSFKKIFSIVDVDQVGQLRVNDYNGKKSLINNNNNNEWSQKDIDAKYTELYSRLSLWAKHHQHTIKIGIELNKLYSPAFVLLLLYEIGTTCLSGFSIIAADIDYLQVITLSFYSFGNLLVLFVVCWLGDFLTDQWEHHLEKGFGSNWYACPRKVHSSLKIIYQRCQTPIRLLGLGVYPVCSQTFLSIVMSAYSYIMVLKQLKLKGHI